MTETTHYERVFTAESLRQYQQEGGGGLGGL